MSVDVSQLPVRRPFHPPPQDVSLFRQQGAKKLIIRMCGCCSAIFLNAVRSCRADYRRISQETT